MVGVSHAAEGCGHSSAAGFGNTLRCLGGRQCVQTIVHDLDRYRGAYAVSPQGTEKRRYVELTFAGQSPVVQRVVDEVVIPWQPWTVIELHHHDAACG
jgi:hypothetical protein